MTYSKTGLSTTTPHHRSPIKKRKMGISLAQKQALIDNLQLESKYAGNQKTCGTSLSSKQSRNALDDYALNTTFKLRVCGHVSRSE
jgi:hypothetical protein